MQRQSIEQVWKNGFLKNDALVAPEVNGLYHQKSQHIVAKFKRRLRLNVWLIFIFAVVNFGIYTSIGVPVAGGVVFLLFMGVGWIALKQTAALQNLDACMPSGDYINSVDNWLQMSLADNEKIARLFYPLVFLGALAPVFYRLKTNPAVHAALVDSKFSMLYGIPVLAWAVALGITGLIWRFSGLLYRWDFNLVYGSMIKKIQELKAEIDLLKIEDDL